VGVEEAGISIAYGYVIALAATIVKGPTASQRPLTRA
jgi:hypothetical protein